jgi:hypothetical protein
MLDVKQEKGRAGWCPLANLATDWYMLCILLESIVILLNHVKEDSYFESQDANRSCTCIKLLAQPEYCVQATLEMRISNPFCYTRWLAWGLWWCIHLLYW